MKHSAHTRKKNIVTKHKIEIKDKNSELLEEFTIYCHRNPGREFFSVLRNFIKEKNVTL